MENDTQVPCKGSFYPVGTLEKSPFSYLYPNETEMYQISQSDSVQDCQTRGVISCSCGIISAVVQALVPIVIILPIVMMLVIMLFGGDSLAFILPYTTSVISCGPILSPLCTLYYVNSYRNALRRSLDDFVDAILRRQCKLVTPAGRAPS